MTTPELTYLIIAIIYLALFLLFLRIFVWKEYAENRYWRRRPHLSLEKLKALANGQPLPFLSIMIPARNEADVIDRTITHMTQLDYPSDRYEIIVVTDGKEPPAVEKERQKLIEQLTHFLTRATPWPGGKKLEGLLITFLAQLLPLPEASELPRSRQLEILRETTEELLSERPFNGQRLTLALHRALKGAPKEQLERLYPYFLSHALPVARTTQVLQGEYKPEQFQRLFKTAARAAQPLTQRVLQGLTDGLGRRLEGAVRVALRDLAPSLTRAAAAYLPTTQEIVEGRTKEGIRHLVVPPDFDGYLGGGRLGFEVPSTKGRALNFALPALHPESRWCLFYDAESRPDPQVLQYVAYHHLTAPAGARILQGPVFQVRNFYQMGFISKVAGLFESISHDWALPVLYRRIPFVGGTNVAVERDLLFTIGGFDHQGLTEDLELGTRAWLAAGVWPEYMPYPSSEQTPPTFAGFYRQRLRWGAGHLQVVDKVRSSPYDKRRRLSLTQQLILKGQAQWIFYQLVALLPLMVWLLYALGHIDPRVIPYGVRLGFSLTPLIYLGFILWIARRYRPFMDAPVGWAPRVWGTGQLLLLPIAAFFLPVPYTSALVLRLSRRSPQAWVKTPRTKE